MKSKKKFSFRIHHRYHLNIKGKRTTVSLEYWMGEVLCLKLDVNPKAENAHSTVRTWLQKKLNEDPKREARINRWLQRTIVFEVMDKNLSKRYDDYEIENYSQK